MGLHAEELRMTLPNGFRVPYPIQTRSEAGGGIQLFDTMAEALYYAHSVDRLVWKISFELPNGERVRLVRAPGSPDQRFYYEGLFDE
jgi:hypothetical protein